MWRDVIQSSVREGAQFACFHKPHPLQIFTIDDPTFPRLRVSGSLQKKPGGTRGMFLINILASSQSKVFASNLTGSVEANQCWIFFFQSTEFVQRFSSHSHTHKLIQARPLCLSIPLSQSVWHVICVYDVVWTGHPARPRRWSHMPIVEHAQDSEVGKPVRT